MPKQMAHVEASVIAPAQLASVGRCLHSPFEKRWISAGAGY